MNHSNKAFKRYHHHLVKVGSQYDTGASVVSQVRVTSRFAINCPRMSQVLPWDMYTRLVVAYLQYMVACVCMIQELYFGPHIIWDLAKETGTVDGKPGHE